MKQPKALTIPTPQGDLAAIAWGEPTAQPVLALHGWLDNAASFDRLAPLLKNVYVVALDFRGHGLSSHYPKGMRYQFTDAIFDIYAVAKHFKWNTFNIMGHSLGGAIAPIFAGSFPQKVNKLVMIDAIGPFNRAAEQAPEQMAKAVKQWNAFKPNMTREYESFEAAVNARTKSGELNYDEAEILARRGTKKTPSRQHASDADLNVEDAMSTPLSGNRPTSNANTSGEHIWVHDKRLMLPSPFYMTENQIIAFIQNITAKCCFIKASRGILQNTHLTARTQHFKQLEEHTLTGHHHIHLQHPKLIAQTINQFLL